MLKALSLKIELLDRRLTEAAAEIAHSDALLQRVIEQQTQNAADTARERTASAAYENDSEVDLQLYERYFIAQERKAAELDLAEARLREDIAGIRERVRTVFAEKERFRLLKEQEEQRIAENITRKENALRDESVMSREWRKQQHAAADGDTD